MIVSLKVISSHLSMVNVRMHVQCREPPTIKKKVCTDEVFQDRLEIMSNLWVAQL